MGRKLSPSALGDFVRCPCCFWLDKVKGIKAPRGIFPSLPGKIDELLKERYDAHREQGTRPAELNELLGIGLYPDQRKLNRWREWRTALVVEFDGIQLSGKLDDLLWAPSTGLVSVLDYKTKGDEPQDGYSTKYYQLQADCYDLLLSGNGMRTSGIAYFVYYSPMRLDQLGAARWKATVQSIPASADNAMTVARAATKCLEGRMPPSSSCEMCGYVYARLHNMVQLQKEES